MMEKFDGIKKQLTELATVLNTFKSEAVQLRILEMVFGGQFSEKKSDQPADGTTSRGRGRQKRKTKKVDAPATDKKNAPAGSGAVATLNRLLSGNYFVKARTIKDIVEHCKHNLARSFKANEFSGMLGRLVRNGQLTRVKNADKQYEYKKS